MDWSRGSSAERRADLRLWAVLAAFALAALGPVVTWAWLGDAASGTPPHHPAPAEIAEVAGAPDVHQFKTGPASSPVESPRQLSGPLVTQNDQRANGGSRAVVAGGN